MIHFRLSNISPFTKYSLKAYIQPRTSRLVYCKELTTFMLPMDSANFGFLYNSASPLSKVWEGTGNTEDRMTCAFSCGQCVCKRTCLSTGHVQMMHVRVSHPTTA